MVKWFSKNLSRCSAYLAKLSCGDWECSMVLSLQWRAGIQKLTYMLIPKWQNILWIALEQSVIGWQVIQDEQSEKFKRVIPIKNQTIVSMDLPIWVLIMIHESVLQIHKLCP
jgi:hypothetical protein